MGHKLKLESLLELLKKFNMLKAILIDDEQASRDTLANYIENYCTGVQVIGTAGSVKEGILSIENGHPDVVFLDIEMPFGNGFDLLDQLEEVNFETVFVTAYSNYAIQAINCSAAYYILKPIDIDELVQAVEKIKSQFLKDKKAFHTPLLVDNLNTQDKLLHKIALPLMDGFEVVQVKDIIRIAAEDNFTKFFLVDGSNRLICRTLKFYEETLGNFDFLRIHKSHMINLQYIKKYTKGKGGFVTMTDGSSVDVAATKKKVLLEKFN